MEPISPAGDETNKKAGGRARAAGGPERIRPDFRLRPLSSTFGDIEAFYAMRLRCLPAWSYPRRPPGRTTRGHVRLCHESAPQSSIGYLGLDPLAMGLIRYGIWVGGQARGRRARPWVKGMIDSYQSDREFNEVADDRFWERLMVNGGIVLVFAAFYLRFFRRP